MQINISSETMCDQGAYHNSFPVVKDPGGGFTMIGCCDKPSLLWQPPHLNIICDGLSVLRY